MNLEIGRIQELFRTDITLTLQHMHNPHPVIQFTQLNSHQQTGTTTYNIPRSPKSTD